MKKIHNRGVTFVELAIAVVVFGILIGPIVSKLVVAMNTSNKSKTAQNKYEFAENLMENIKNEDDEFFDPTKSGLTAAVQNATKAGTVQGVAGNGKINGKTFDGYVMTGQAKVGRKSEDFYYAIHVNNIEYAKKEGNESTYENPNNQILPAIANFDAKDFAIINGTIGNYDLTVTNAFMSKKLDILRVGDKARWEQYTKQQADIVAFPNDSATRVVEISVEEGSKIKDGETKKTYTVTCKLRYKDKSTYILKDGVYAGKNLSSYLSPIEYVPYKQTFYDTLPAIYLMYNPCLYNSNYMDNDYILLNTSKVSSDQNVELYVVETAEQFSEDAIKGIVEAYRVQYKEEHAGTEPSQSQLNQVEQSYRNSYLINNDAIKERANVNVNIMCDDPDAENVKVYHNFDENAGGTKTPISSVNKYTVVPAGDTNMVSGYNFVKQINMKNMSEAAQIENPLYSVDIYISDKPYNISDYSDFLTDLSVDSTTGRMTKYKNSLPIISGSKGGN